MVARPSTGRATDGCLRSDAASSMDECPPAVGDRDPDLRYTTTPV